MKNVQEVILFKSKIVQKTGNMFHSRNVYFMPTLKLKKTAAKHRKKYTIRKASKLVG